MNLQVLIASMHQTDYSLLEKMNIQSDAIVGNQCDHDQVDRFQWNGHQICYLSFSERGVGLNRNNALMRATGDICLFADDDMRYHDNYTALVEQAFSAHPDADAIVFNITIQNGHTESRRNTSSKRVRWYNALSYGTCRLAVKTDSIRRENLAFHHCFGGGTMYSCGEDSLFIADMLKHGLRIYTFPISIAEVHQNESTWFSGYSKKYLYDKGALFRALSHRWGMLLCLQDLFRHPYQYKDAGLTFGEAWALMKSGRIGFAQLKPYSE